MSRINTRLQQMASMIIYSAKRKIMFNRDYKHTSDLPSMFDGNIDQYISWLKYFKKQAKINNLEILMSLSGKITLTKKSKEDKI